MRNQAITALRPQLQLAPASKSSEAFQNTVLRPILKLQNAITLQLLNANKYYDPSTIALGVEKLDAHLSALLQKDKAFRNQVLGMVIGMMTESEFEFYKADRKEYHKRIITMQLARYIDQLS